ncbi:hypothetical protein [Legionella norrlandica]|uniref:hypothetical protein n=1 Tax=Legionella norrlandica TaxID=1498499 RepID=UPI00068A3A9C|nr:hypothetical protein [Legionella norrlandica]
MALVKEFICSVGVFPPGSLVELNTGELAIVLSHNRTLRFQPCLMVITDNNKNPNITPWMLDLRESCETSYSIIREVKPEEYNINPEAFYL